MNYLKKYFPLSKAEYVNSFNEMNKEFRYVSKSEISYVKKMFDKLYLAAKSGSDPAHGTLKYAEREALEETLKDIESDIDEYEEYSCKGWFTIESTICDIFGWGSGQAEYWG